MSARLRSLMSFVVEMIQLLLQFCCKFTNLQIRSLTYDTYDFMLVAAAQVASHQRSPVGIDVLQISIYLQIVNMAEKSLRGSSSLPLARVKTIMKSSPEVSNIGQDSLFLIAKSAVSEC